jgi:hypothetical protein
MLKKKRKKSIKSTKSIMKINSSIMMVSNVKS